MDSDQVDFASVSEEVPAGSTLSTGEARPTVWPAFVVVLVVIALSIGAQIAVAIALTVGHMAQGGEPDSEVLRQVTEGFFLSPVGFILMAGFGQIAFLGSVLVATRLLPGSRVEQLGLTRPRLPGTAYLALAAGTGVPVAIGVGLTRLLSLLFEPMVNPELIWSRITPLTFVPYVLFIALAPGFIEEITFRGFVQRRLLLRFRPRAAIAWSAVLFAVAHVDPHAALFVLPLGVWLGVIAWRLGVVWPCIACHAALNGLWSIYFIGAVKTEPSTGYYVASAIGVGAISIVGFVASLRILSSAKR